MDRQHTETREELFAPGHRACHGCGMALAVRHILRATGSNVVVVTPTACLETFSSPYGYSPWRVPWFHHLFENGPALASGIAAGLRTTGRPDVRTLVIGGDGATFDIGFGSLSGMLERGDDVLYCCVDNGAYMNTGGQRSGGTPTYSATTTDPPGTASRGKVQAKKDLPAIVAAHGAAYVATASVAFLRDLRRKVRRAMEFTGPRYIEIDTPCPSGWGFPADQTLEMARQSFQSGLTPLFEMEEGRLTRVRRVAKPRPVREVLRTQARFKHLSAAGSADEELARLERLAETNFPRYGLLKPEAEDEEKS